MPHGTDGLELGETRGRRVVEGESVSAREVVDMLSVARSPDQHVDHDDDEEASTSTATPSTASLIR